MNRKAIRENFVSSESVRRQNCSQNSECKDGNVSLIAELRGKIRRKYNLKSEFKIGILTSAAKFGKCFYGKQKADKKKVQQLSQHFEKKMQKVQIFTKVWILSNFTHF